MQIVEVKNNLVKIKYDVSLNPLILSGFVVIKDAAQSFVAQIVHLESNPQGSFAIAKLLFNFNPQGIITNYNGAIPGFMAEIVSVHTSELLELLPVQNPIAIGDLAQQNTHLNLDFKLLEQKLLVCVERQEERDVIAENFISQLVLAQKPVIFIDTKGIELPFGRKIVAGDDFKLPLNYETINFIYEKGLNDASAETKAMIQQIFLEVQDYVKSLPEKFIPFETFKSVVDEQYDELGLVELVLLKNKLLKYYEEGIFAQDKKDFLTLKTAVKSENFVQVDVSNVHEFIQREMISYVYSVLSEIDSEVYVFVDISNQNSDKKLLKQIFSSINVYTTVLVGYGYKYLKELKQLSRDIILFAPIQQQDDFASYGVFLDKLNPQEFIIYGHATHYLPLIVKLGRLDLPEIKSVSQPINFAQDIEQMVAAEPLFHNEVLDAEIKKDVDEIFTAPKQPDSVFESEILTQEDLTEDDLDLLDDLNLGEQVEKVQDEKSFEAESLQEVFVENEDISDFIGIAEEAQFEAEPQAVSGQQIEEEPVFQVFSPKKKSSEEPESVEETINQLFDTDLAPSESAPEEIYQPNIENSTAEQNISDFDKVMEQEAQPSQEPPSIDILPVKSSSTPIVPIYSAEVEQKHEPEAFVQGDEVLHPKYGKGVVEKLISYGTKTLCSIHFDNVGRRLLDPSLAEIKKV